MTAGAGFENTLVFAENADFSGGGASGEPALANGLQTNGQLWIGSTAVNAGNTHINVGNITSPLGTLNIGYTSPNITVDLVGGSTGIDSFIPDTGTSPVVPTAAGAVSVLGRSGSKTEGGTNSITVKSPPYADIAAPTSVTLNSGTFATAAITLTTPVSAGLLDGDLVEIIATNGVVVVQLAATQVAHLGTAVTSVAGTITGSATGDSISLRYQASTNDWWATSAVGVWVLA